MTFSRNGIFQIGLMLATAISVCLWADASQAYTPEQEQACTGDAFRLCSSEIPNVDRVTACMVAKQSQLSPQCRVHFRSAPEPRAAAGAPTNIKPVARKQAPTQARKPKPAKKPAGT